MSERLTDEELTDLVIRAGALGDRSKHLAREAVAELRDRRARDLTVEEREALESLRDRVGEDIDDGADTSGWMQKQCAALDRLLGGGK